MANIISGQIIAIDKEPKVIPSKNGGNPFYKREFVITALRFNPNDATPELNEKNTPIIEFQGQEPCKLLDAFHLGDVVKVSFNVGGRRVVNNDGTAKYFNTLRAYSIEKMNVKLTQPQPQTQVYGQQPQGYGQQPPQHGQYAGNPFFDGMQGAN
jgi:hypothetical protein